MRMRHAFPALALAIAASASGDFTAPAGPPASIQLLSSASLTGIAGDTLAPITVEVRDSLNHRVPGVLIDVYGVADQGVYRYGTDYRATATDTGVRTDPLGRATIYVIAPTYAGPGTIDVGIDASAQPPTGLVRNSVNVSFTTVAGPFAQFYSSRARQPRFLGTTVLLDSLFAPVDRFGNPVPWPAAHATATDGWQTRGDTIVPPNASAEASTVVSVTAAGATATRSVSLVTDLRKYRWSLRWTCGATPADVAAGAPDSLVANGRSGIAYYSGDAGYDFIEVMANITQPAVEFSFTGTYTTYRGGVGSAGADIMGNQPYNWDASAQRPDTVVFGVDTYARTLVRVPGTPLPRYVSPTAWCTGLTLQPLTLEAY